MLGDAVVAGRESPMNGTVVTVIIILVVFSGTRIWSFYLRRRVLRSRGTGSRTGWPGNDSFWQSGGDHHGHHGGWGGGDGGGHHGGGGGGGDGGGGHHG
jgi:hypothetical protein